MTDILERGPDEARDRAFEAYKLKLRQSDPLQNTLTVIGEDIWHAGYDAALEQNASLLAEVERLTKTVITLQPHAKSAKGENDPDAICQCGHFRTQHSPVSGGSYPVPKHVRYGCINWGSQKCDCKGFKFKGLQAFTALAEGEK